jgi:hypothetical protein
MLLKPKPMEQIKDKSEVKNELFDIRLQDAISENIIDENKKETKGLNHKMNKAILQKFKDDNKAGRNSVTSFLM